MADPFIVDDANLGIPEHRWASSPAVTVQPLSIPAVRRAIVLAPHPDDEILGAGGLMHRLARSGVEVEVWGVTDGEASDGDTDAQVSAYLAVQRCAEVHIALGRMGLAGVERRRLHLRDGGVRAGDVIDRLRPHLSPDVLIIAPWQADGHPDHDAVGIAAAHLSELTGARLLHYLIWAWHWADPEGDDIPWETCRKLELTRREVAAKRWATAAFVSQVGWLSPTGAPVLPAAVRSRFRRRWEVFIEPVLSVQA